MIVLADPRALLIRDEAHNVGRYLRENAVDAWVTDPPAGIAFMGKGWDKDHGGRDGWIAKHAAIFAEALRVMKPGAHGLVWALPRTSHWTATALEDAGFEIRDIHLHLFGTGFPKSLNIGEGRGTALKPAAEHWILVRKPLTSTVAANVLEHGTGALNIDACRIGEDVVGRGGGASGPEWRENTGGMKGGEARPVAGRWPAHVSLDEEAAAVLDAQSGVLKSGARAGKTAPNASMFGVGAGGPCTASEGGASRFFYVAKPSRAERDRGCEHLPPKSGSEITGREEGSAGSQHARAGAGARNGARNFHPTVKAQALMRWLIRLITPPGGLVLDTFCGSGSTGVAALAEGCEFVGIDRDLDDNTGEVLGYCEVAKARLEHALKGAK